MPRLLLIILLVTIPITRMKAESLPLRSQISLNGIWETGGMVPVYAGSTFDKKTYQRQVLVPAAWKGKTVKLAFGAVNYVADIYINGQWVQQHIGGWVPFSVEITPFCRPGKAFTLRVDVKSRNAAPVLDTTRKPLWPLGYVGSSLDEFSGITDEVWLRAYGRIHVEEAFIQPSFRKKALEVAYTIRNTKNTTQTVWLEAAVLTAASDSVAKRFPGQKITLAPRETKVVNVQWNWPDAKLWWPDQPVLYYLQTSLSKGAVIDVEKRRFGFREIWTEGNQFKLNGIRVNFRGDYTVYGKDNHWPAESFLPANWGATIDTIKNLNINLLRMHKNPPPQFVLDVADEKGLCILSESSLNGAVNLKTLFKEYNKELFLTNSRQWVQAWIRANRNHPSIVLWSAMNEMYNLTPEEAHSIGEAIRTQDTTRPVLYEDHGDVGDQTVSYHYPREKTTEWDSEPDGTTIYGWAKYVQPGKPTVVNECLYVPATARPNYAQTRNTWWQGIWTRGMRYVNWAAISGGVYRWIHEEKNELKKRNVANAFHPVALFDKDYDNAGLTPFVTDTSVGGLLPEVKRGEVLERTLVVYNDEFSDSAVTVDVTLVMGATIMGKASKTLVIPLGQHYDIPYSFRVPHENEPILQVVLRTFKGGKKRFEEVKRFNVSTSGSNTPYSPLLSIGELCPPAYQAPTKVTATSSRGKVHLNWQGAPGAEAYVIKRSLKSQQNFRTSQARQLSILYTPIASGVRETSYVDDTVETGTTYYYVVCSMEGGVVSGPSREVSAKPE